jgi:hypothetical protein
VVGLRPYAGVAGIASAMTTTVAAHQLGRRATRPP